MQNFQNITGCAELEQILHFKGFVMKQAKILPQLIE